VLEAKHLLGQFLRSEPRFCAGRGMWLWLHKIRTENVREPAQAKKIEDLLLMKVFGRGLMTVRRRNIALVPWRKIRDRIETLAWAIFAQRAPILCGKRDVVRLRKRPCQGWARSKKR